MSESIKDLSLFSTTINGVKPNRLPTRKPPIPYCYF